MTKEKYLNERKTLLDQANTLIDEGKLEDFEAKKKEIEALDNQFENAAKARANLEALTNPPAPVSLENHSQSVTGPVSASVSLGGAPAMEDMYDSAEYKASFMGHVLRGAPIPEKFTNADANTKTSDVGAVIPTTTMQKIVEKMESIGMILPLVTHTSYKGGMSVPTSSVKPTATWVAEGAGSDKQKKTTGSITFSYYKLRCAISMSLETTVVTYPMFETQFINNVSEAMVKAKEQAIISGSGSGRPKGILTESVAEGQNVDITEGSKITYADLVAAEAALPQAYDAGAVWCMTKKTFMTQIVGMVDSNGQPVARTNYGIAGKPEYSIIGRRVVLVGDYMPSFAASVSADTVVAFMFNFKDYILNTNYNVTVKRYTDDDTDDEIVKAIELVDGKVVDKNSLVTVTLKNAP